MPQPLCCDRSRKLDCRDGESDTANGDDVMPRAPLPEPQGPVTEPGGLTVRTVPIADPGDLLAGLPKAPLLSWVRRGRGLVGWGEAARITLSAGEDRFTAGEKRLRTLFESVTCEDQVRVPGTGPVAFGSFTFDPASDGSVLIVPRVIVGRDGAGTAWLTTVSDGREPAGRQSWAGAAGPDGEPGEPADCWPPGPLRWHDGSLTTPEWAHAVELAVDRITAGQLRKVVLARDVFATAAGPIDPRPLLPRLGRRQPHRHTL